MTFSRSIAPVLLDLAAGVMPHVEPVPDTNAASEATRDASFAASDLLPACILLGSAIVLAIIVRYGFDRAFSRWNAIIVRLIARTAATVVVLVGLVYALSSLGIKVGLLIGALGIGGFALAFALRDTLENLISGVILQIRQPFSYNDTVELGDYAGTVTDINLRAVEMTVFSGEKVILPSKDVLQSPIENWTANPTRRIDVAVGVSYDVDIDDACRVITESLRDVHQRLDDPPPDTVFERFGDSSIDLVARVWYRSDGPYFDVKRDVAARVKRGLDAAGISIPFPIRTIVGGDSRSRGPDAEPSSSDARSTGTGTSVASGPGRHRRAHDPAVARQH